MLEAFDRGSNNISQSGAQEFKDFIQGAHLTELPASNGWFTWFRGPAKSKLYRLLVNPEWISLLPSLHVSLLKRNISDHCPLLIKIDEHNWGPKPFKFQNGWLSHPGCMKIIKEIWGNSSVENFGEKLKIARGKLKAWNMNEFGDVDHKITCLEDRIHELDLLLNDMNLTKIEIAERRSA